MAQFVHQYVQPLLQGQARAGQMLGVGVYGVDRESYVLNLTLLTLIGVVMKKVSEVAPAVTDAVWLDALNHALDASAGSPWPQAMLDQVDPGATPAVG
jgi:hypothetical protein